ELCLPGCGPRAGSALDRRPGAAHRRPASGPDPAAGPGRARRPRPYRRPRPLAGPDRERAGRFLRACAPRLPPARRRRTAALCRDRRRAAAAGGRRGGCRGRLRLAGCAAGAGMSMAGFAPWQQRLYRQATDALDTGRLGHALLLCGPAGLGKRAVIEALAHYVLCDARAAGQPCGRCRSCELFATRSQRDPLEVRPDGSPAQPGGHSAHPDLVFVGYEWRLKPGPPRMRTEIVIEQMRQLSERLEVSASFTSRVAVVEPADAVNYSAW